MNFIVTVSVLASGFIALPAYIPTPTQEKLIAVSVAQILTALLLGSLVPTDPVITTWVSIALLLAHLGWSLARFCHWFIERYRVKKEAKKYLAV